VCFVGVCRSGGNIVLGLCWLRQTPTRFVAGSENGCIEMFDINHMKGAALPLSFARSSCCMFYVVRVLL